MNREARKERVFSSEQKGEGGGNSNCRWEGILIVADHGHVLGSQNSIWTAIAISAEDPSRSIRSDTRTNSTLK